MSNGITFDVETITPAMARGYLQRNTRNRKLSERVSGRYARIMRDGKWRLNGETIKFNLQGELIDGQHRLRGIVLADRPIEICVIRGLECDTFKTLDGGKVRTAGDCLYVLQYKHPNALAAAGRMVFAYERGWGRIQSNTVTNDQLLDVIKRHPDLVDRAHEFMLRPIWTPLIPHSVGMFVYYFASRIDPERSREFFKELAGNVRGSSPAMVLRDTLIERGSEVLRPSSRLKLAWTVEAWNHHIARRRLPRLSRIIETLPRFEPDPLTRGRRR